ncbi:hypothetical protein PoB_003557100 [Plakobranchus ocellatus]|uniref:Uncharacterized protein n=1 Tax=Plakobranchus ocellatus TaxID=259542 RepID=A0AAV4ALL6_9GAST|nr:hypothetical protein PoB_003557100 [Plakobranchus ocellatus]
MPVRNACYIEMRARNCDKEVNGLLNVSVTNIHVEHTDRTPQTSNDGDAGYFEMRDFRLDDCFQDQSKVAIENINCESRTMKGEHKRISIIGGGIECTREPSIKDSYTGGSREECADTSVKKQFAHAISDGEYANAMPLRNVSHLCKNCVDASVNKDCHTYENKNMTAMLLVLPILMSYLCKKNSK